MTLKLTSLKGNSQLLDGGAMFGNVPKALWSQWVSVDEHNRIELACRCLLVQAPGQNILLETGIGAFFAPKLQKRYGVVEKEHVLLESLKAIGLSADDIDTIILSHMHFDHAGGLLKSYQEGASPALAFSNANIVVSKAAWERALQPHPRDRASFIPELPSLIDEKRLFLVKDTMCPSFLPINFAFEFSEGHTPGMMLTHIKGNTESIVFGADLVPGTAWVHLPVTMGYDRYPEKVVDEKKALLDKLVDEGAYLFYTHDPETACSQVTCSDGRKYIPTNELDRLEAYELTT